MTKKFNNIKTNANMDKQEFKETVYTTGLLKSYNIKNMTKLDICNIESSLVLSIGVVDIDDIISDKISSYKRNCITKTILLQDLSKPMSEDTSLSQTRPVLNELTVRVVLKAINKKLAEKANMIKMARRNINIVLNNDKYEYEYDNDKITSVTKYTKVKTQNIENIVENADANKNELKALSKAYSYEEALLDIAKVLNQTDMFNFELPSVINEKNSKAA